MESKSHCESVYGSQSAEAVPWYRSRAQQSLKMTRRIAAGWPSQVIDIGGGAATLVDNRRRLRTAGAPERGTAHAVRRGAAVCLLPLRTALRRAVRWPAIEVS